MKRVRLHVGCWLLFSLLGLGFLETEVAANQILFDDFMSCPSVLRQRAPTQLAVYKTEQLDQLLVTWDRASAGTWRLHGDTARVRVVVEGAAGFQERFTALQTSRVLFEDVVGPGPWWVYVVAVDQGHLISDIGAHKFDLATLVRESDWDRVHRYRRLVPPVTQALGTSPELPSYQPVTIHYGAYDDLEQHSQGLFHLTRVGTEVTATFTSAGSVVEPRMVLLTMPPEYWPATAESREVEGWSVAERVRGTGVNTRSLRYLRPDALKPTRFRLQVEPNGEVVYGTGSTQEYGDPLAYMLTTTWTTVAGPPAAGDLCTRHPVVKEALRQALASPGQAPPLCGTVAGEALAGVTALELELGLGHAPLRRRDLAGLDGLRQLTLNVPVYQFPWWSGDLLAGVPTLKVLDLILVEDELDVPVELRDQLPTLTLAEQGRQWAGARTNGYWRGLSAQKLRAILAHTPALQVLRVNGPFRELIPDLLAHTPDLRELVLQGEFRDLPDELLAPVPHLQQLDLDSPLIQALPQNFLSHAGELEVLSLRVHDYNKYNQYLRVDWPSGFLHSTPALRELRLASEIPVIFPPDFLDYTPRLQVLALEVDYSYSGAVPIPDLPNDMLARTPLLHTLVLQGDITNRYLAWLRHAGELRTLTLGPQYLMKLPPGVLRHTPQLQALTLDLPRLEQVPPNLLRHTPQLQALTLDLPRLEQMPSNLLHFIPLLESLQLNVPQVPAELLRHTPRLQTLQLKVWDQDELSADLLKYAPQLQILQLYSNNLKHLTADVLRHSPNLQNLSLQLPELESFPDQQGNRKVAFRPGSGVAGAPRDTHERCLGTEQINA